MCLAHSLNNVEVSHPFFPNAMFGVFFVTTITLFLATASVIDARTLRIPKWLTVPLFVLGLFINIARGAWLSQQGNPVWLFTGPGGFTGAIDGALFSLAGAILGFAIFLLFWLARICGGGDVKLVASVCAWIGPELGIYVIAFSTSLVCLWILILFFRRFAGSLAFKNANQPVTSQHRSKRGEKETDAEPAPSSSLRGRRISFSFSVAVATLIVGLLAWHTEIAPAIHMSI